MANNEFGDFQTPLPLARACLSLLGIPSNARIFEPTCGRGAFLQVAEELAPDSERIGVEINEEYATEASTWAKVATANVFEVDLFETVSWRTSEPLFVVGNPPWVTSAELGRMNSQNLPPKENVKNVSGLEALLGSSNFDVCEYIMLKLLREFSREPFVLGMLCKTQVARNVIDHASTAGLPLVDAAIYRINAMKWFNAGVDACWFTLRVDSRGEPDYTVAVYGDVFDPYVEPQGRFGVVNSRLVSDVDRYMLVHAADGKSPYEWRSGLKHDASRVFELIASPAPTTKTGQILDLEADYVYPFLKSTDIYRGRHRELSKWVIVPQKEFGAETNHVSVTAPHLWAYLESHSSVLDKRKSSIYKNRPRFSVFGHGEYTFAPYKVAVSGLHKQPVFRLVTPLNGQPVVLDDTCYLLPFDDATEAAVVTAVLNSQECIALIESLVFWDSKRPITKKLLSRLDLNALPVQAEAVIESARSLAEAEGIPFDTRRAVYMLGRLGKSHEVTPGLL